MEWETLEDVVNRLSEETIAYDISARVESFDLWQESIDTMKDATFFSPTHNVVFKSKMHLDSFENILWVIGHHHSFDEFKFDVEIKMDNNEYYEKYFGKIPSEMNTYEFVYAFYKEAHKIEDILFENYGFYKIVNNNRWSEPGASGDPSKVSLWQTSFQEVLPPGVLRNWGVGNVFIKDWDKKIKF